MTTTTAPHFKRPKDEQLLDFIENLSPEADPTSVLLFRQLRRANHMIIHTSEKALERVGLTWPKFMLLLVLYGNETYGTGDGMQPSELSDMQGIPRNHVSMVLTALEEEGLVSRELHGTDRRKFVIRLTPQGRKTVKSRIGTQFRQVSRLFSAFTAEERTTLLSLLTRLSQGLAERND